jgi:hypothetical protein
MALLPTRPQNEKQIPGLFCAVEANRPPIDLNGTEKRNYNPFSK